MHKPCSRAFEQGKPLKAMDIAIVWTQLAYAMNLDIDEARERTQRLANL